MVAGFRGAMTIEWVEYEIPGGDGAIRIHGLVDGVIVAWISHAPDDRIWVRYDAAFPDVQGLLPKGSSVDDAKRYVEHWHRVHGVLHPEPDLAYLVPRPGDTVSDTEYAIREIALSILDGDSCVCVRSCTENESEIREILRRAGWRVSHESPTGRWYLKAVQHDHHHTTESAS